MMFFGALLSQSSAVATEENKDVAEECQICRGALRVCEDHEDKPWGGASSREDACHCGCSGMPGQACNPNDREHKPKMPEGYRTIYDRDE